MQDRNQPDFKNSIPWRIFRIMAEFVDGFEMVTSYQKSVSIFGSTRTKDGSHYYEDAKKLAAMFAKKGYTVVTGGASGIMEAANRGAFEAGGESIGYNIELPREQKPNNFLSKSIDFHYFFTRKVMLSFAAEAYIFFPGGFGTLDEFSEIVTLIQTKKIKKVPVVLIERSYWQPMLDWFKNTMLEKNGHISPEDLEIFYVTDDLADVVSFVDKSIKDWGLINLN